MPNLDHKGPDGNGPTGLGRGSCPNKEKTSESIDERGLGRGSGRGRGRLRMGRGGRGRGRGQGRGQGRC